MILAFYSIDKLMRIMLLFAISKKGDIVSKIREELRKKHGGKYSDMKYDQMRNRGYSDDYIASNYLALLISIQGADSSSTSSCHGSSSSSEYSYDSNSSSSFDSGSSFGGGFDGGGCSGF